MAELLSSSGDGFHWNVNFVRLVQGWELESVVTFLDLIYFGLVRGNRVDQLCWIPSASGLFDVKYFYKVLCSSTHSFFPLETFMEAKGANKGWFLHVDSSFGAYFNYR